MKTLLIRLLLLALVLFGAWWVVDLYSAGFQSQMDARDDFARRSAQQRGAAIEAQVEQLGAERDARAQEILDAAGGGSR